MRIFVTGIGVMSPLGLGAAATMDALLDGRCAIGPLTLFELPGCQARIAAEVRALDVAEVAGGDALGWSRSDALAVLAAREALEHARLRAADGVSLIVATTTSGMLESEQLLSRLTEHPDALSPGAALRAHPLSAPADRVHQRLGPFTQVQSLCSACSGGATAILLAAAAIASGKRERVLAGGTDALCRLTYAGFSALSALDMQPCRPFDRSRAGLSLGEGAAFLLLESERSMRARDARPIAELRGWAMAAEAYHITHPEPQGHTATRVMRRALDRAGLAPEQLDYINAHGTATPHNDEMEATAIRALLGPHHDRVAVSSIKGHIGHTLASAGALEAAVTAMAIERGVLPPTVGLVEPDPACALRHVQRPLRQPIGAALSNAFGFGGTDTVLVLTDPALPRDRAVHEALPADASSAVAREGELTSSTQAPAASSPAALGAGEPISSTQAPAVASPIEEPSAGEELVISGVASWSALGLHAGGDMLPLLEAEIVSDPLQLPSGILDPLRARRMGRAARAATLVTAAALNQRHRRAASAPSTAELNEPHRLAAFAPSAAPSAEPEPSAVASASSAPSIEEMIEADAPGLVVGSLSGCVSACGELLVRLFRGGVRQVRPLSFPSVLPSTLSSSASIYLSLRGPVLTVADLSASGEAAVLGALAMVAGGEGEVMVAAAIEERSEVVERHAGPECMDLPPDAQRSEGAAAVVIERATSAARRGIRPLAKVTWRHAWRGTTEPAIDHGLTAEPAIDRGPTTEPAMDHGPTNAPPPPFGRAAVFRVRPAARAHLRWDEWSQLPSRLISDTLGHHEATGGMAIALAAAAIDAGKLDCVLVVGAAPDRGYALLLQTVDEIAEACGA